MCIVGTVVPDGPKYCLFTDAASIHRTVREDGPYNGDTKPDWKFPILYTLAARYARNFLSLVDSDGIIFASVVGFAYH